jgi:hypothetical protein
VDGTLSEFVIGVCVLPVCYFLFGRNISDTGWGRFIFYLKSAVLVALILTPYTAYKDGVKFAFFMFGIWVTVFLVIFWGISAQWKFESWGKKNKK